MQRLRLLAAVIVVWSLVGGESSAQLVQVGPGYVKAPFVRVYKYPDGSTYVRAPFVRTFRPGYHYGPAYGPDGGPLDAASLETEVERMSWPRLTETIRVATAQLDALLAQMKSGDAWRERLATAEIAALVPTQAASAPSAETRARLQAIVADYDVLAEQYADANANRVVNGNAFRMLHAALREYAQPPTERLRRQLMASAAELEQSLGRFPTGAQWRDYLALTPPAPANDEQAAENRVELRTAPLSREEAERALARFKAIDESSEYPMIARLPAFQTTHENLSRYVQELKSPTTRPAAEELPVPKAE